MSEDESVKPKQPEARREVEFTDPSWKAIYELARAGIIRPHPTPLTDEVVLTDVDTDKAVGVLEKCVAATSQAEVPQVDEQEFVDKSKRAVQQTIKAFVQNGDVPAGLAVMTGKILRPSNVKLTSEDYAQFLYWERSFPTKPEQKASLEMALRYVFGQAEKVRRLLLSPNNVDLTDEQVLNFVLRETAAHEYGHATHRVLELMQWGNYLKGVPEGERPDKGYPNVAQDLEQEVFDKIAPDEDLTKLLAGESVYVDRSSTSFERIASGFQDLGAAYVLRDAGVDPAKISAIQATYAQSGKRTLAMHKALIEGVKAHGLSIYNFANGIKRLEIDLNQRGRHDLAGIIHNHFNFRVLGYFYPLSREQVHAFVRAFWIPDLKIDDKLNQRMKQEGGPVIVIKD